MVVNCYTTNQYEKIQNHFQFRYGLNKMAQTKLGLEERTIERWQKQEETLEQNPNARWKSFVAFQQSLEDVSVSPQLTAANDADSM